MRFANAYSDTARAEAYAGLAFPGTYYLAFRDLPGLLAAHAAGTAALDFGCGTGRSTRFLRGLGFDPVGVDIAPEMIRRARALDPDGRYRLIDDGDFAALPRGSFDLVLSVLTFDNIPAAEHRVRLLRGLRDRLNGTGIMVLVDAAPELYTREWASFSTAPFPENRRAGSGDIVRVVMLDVEDRRPVEDVLWLDDDYRRAFLQAGLDIVAEHRPLGRASEPYAWVSEEAVPPWVVYVLRPADPA